MKGDGERCVCLCAGRGGGALYKCDTALCTGRMCICKGGPGIMVGFSTVIYHNVWTCIKKSHLEWRGDAIMERDRLLLLTQGGLGLLACAVSLDFDRGLCKHVDLAHASGFLE